MDSDFDKNNRSEIIVFEYMGPSTPTLSIKEYNDGLSDLLVIEDHFASFGDGLADIDNDGDEDFYFFQNNNSSPGLVYYLSEDTSSTHLITNATLNIYSNPVVDFINIEIDRALNFRVNLYDLAGKLIRSAENTSRFNIESILPGTYLLEVDQLDSGQKIIETIVVGQ